MIWHDSKGNKPHIPFFEYLVDLVFFGAERAILKKAPGVPRDVIDLGRGLEVSDEEYKSRLVFIINKYFFFVNASAEDMEVFIWGKIFVSHSFLLWKYHKIITEML